MRESAVLKNLEEIAVRLDIKVCTVNLRKYSYGIKGGLCRLKGQYRVIIDKHLHLSEKIDVLIDALQNFDLEAVLVDPDVKKFFKKKAVCQPEFEFSRDPGDCQETGYVQIVPGGAKQV